MPALKEVEILGVRVHDVTMPEALTVIELMVQSGRQHHIVTVNPEFIMIAQQSNLFRETLNKAALSLPDGIGVVWASRFAGSPIAERVTGVDTVMQIAALAGRLGLRLFLLGAKTGVAERVADLLQKQQPGLIVAGTYAGSPSPSEEEEICDRIQVAAPHILFVAYGAPQQDLWIRRNLPRLGVPVSMGVGGTFDFIAGVAVRAPRWMQEHGLEWLHRLMREPRRYRRMLVLPRFAFEVVRFQLKNGSRG